MADHPTHHGIDLFAGDFYANEPHEYYTWMRANAPVYFDEANNVWGIAKYDDVKAIARNPKSFSSAGGCVPGMGPMPMMIDMDDPDHLRRRKIVNKGFTPRRVHDLEAKVRAVCDEILDSVQSQGSCDLVRDIAAPLPMIMIGDALGVAPEDRADLLRWSDDMVSAQSNSASEGALLAAADAFAEYQAYAAKVIAERRSRPVDVDLMSILVHAEVDGDALDDEELVQESLLILVGGDETTRHVISGGTEQLLRHPDQWQNLRQRPDLLPSAVEEMLRWVTPIKTMSRVVTADIEFGGQQMRQGQELVLLYHSANRDESVFDSPFDFDVQRDPNEHVAFGFGTHCCLGASLARLEVRVMTERLIERMPDLELAGDTPTRPANFITGFEAMPVRWSV
ncbi:MAG: cytochrome P450 [Microthrixaceae bacterium]